jgi:hypothetical protein
MVAALEELKPARVGVVGPKCKEGNQKILTHDFTHRTHAAIFQVGSARPNELHATKFRKAATATTIAVAITTTAPITSDIIFT